MAVGTILALCLVKVAVGVVILIYQGLYTIIPKRTLFVAPMQKNALNSSCHDASGIVHVRIIILISLT